MKVVGIISEYNPFHNGHAYHINKAKEITGADCAIVIMSGNYVQRGEPAVFNKYLRTECALKNGADIVIELPLIFSTASAEIFAAGAVSLLCSLGVVDYICFGSESGDINKLTLLAELLSDTNVDTSVKKHLKSGLSYPAAVSAAAADTIFDIPNSDNILQLPNNILAIEYLKSLKKLNSNIIPVTIKRSDNGYNDLSVENFFSSAASIRKCMQSSEYDIDMFSHAIPDNCLEILNSETSHALFTNDFSQVLGSKLITYNVDELNSIYDISNDFANKILKSKSAFTNIDDFAMQLKSKDLTFNYIKRGLLHILLDVKCELMNKVADNNYKSYARLLGFKKNCAALSAIKSNADIPIISKFSYAHSNFSSLSKEILDTNLNGDHLYRMIAMNKHNCEIPTEFQSNIVII